MRKDGGGEDGRRARDDPVAAGAAAGIVGGRVGAGARGQGDGEHLSPEGHGTSLPRHRGFVFQCVRDFQRVGHACLCGFPLVVHVLFGLVNFVLQRAELGLLPFQLGGNGFTLVDFAVCLVAEGGIGQGGVGPGRGTRWRRRSALLGGLSLRHQIRAPEGR